MSSSTPDKKPTLKDYKEYKAALEAALEEEDRMSRRQALLKKLWKLKKQYAETGPS